MKITNHIKTLRTKKNMTQTCLASLCNISERQLQRIEQGKQDPRTSTALKLAKTLNTTTEELFKLPSENNSRTQNITMKGGL